MPGKIPTQSGHVIYYAIHRNQNPDKEIVVLSVRFHGETRVAALTRNGVISMLEEVRQKGKYEMTENHIILELKIHHSGDLLLRIYPEMRDCGIEEDPETLIPTLEDLTKALIPT